MCTIVILRQINSKYPLIIAANRDELYARPSYSPRRIYADPIVVGGVDGREHGTWMGGR